MLAMNPSLHVNQIALGVSVLLHAAVLTLLLMRLQSGAAIQPAAIPDPFMAVSFITSEPDKPKPVTAAPVTARPPPRVLPARAADVLPATMPRPAPTSDAVPQQVTPAEPSPAQEAKDPITRDFAGTATAQEAELSAITAEPPSSQTQTKSKSELPLMREPRFRAPPRPPNYPRLSRQRGESGTVLVRARVEPDGSITHIQLASSSGHALLDRAALLAVRDWEIEPWRQGAIALAAWVELPVIFKLQDHASFARRN